MTVLNTIKPLYTVYFYTDFLYRVVKFKRSGGTPCLRDHHDGVELDRFDQSYSRSRSMVLQYALCNQWEYFITITVDPNRFDRWDLDAIYKYLSQWFRDYRKKYGVEMAYLLVPEHHKDGAWHFHGLVRGIRPEHLSAFIPGIHPQKLIDNGYINFGLLGATIGYVSLSKLTNPVGAAFYICKYITKEHAHDAFYQHLYYHSQGLSKARPVSDVYAFAPELEECLDFETPFCCCGWAKDKTWDFPYTLHGAEPRMEEALSLEPVQDVLAQLEEAAPAFEPVQLTLTEWQR